MRNILVNDSKRTPLDKQPVEIVERKGVGHPDSMCDAIMDQVSVELSKAYLKEFGAILHHILTNHCLLLEMLKASLGVVW